MAKILVLYYSTYGHIEKMAEAVAEGAKIVLERLDAVSNAFREISKVGGLTADTIYYISSVVDSKHIILASDIKLKNTLVLSNGTGTMTGRVVVNKRGGVWRVNIINNIVSLTFIKEVNLGQRVRILSGSTFASAIVYYSIELQPGQNVPFYKVCNVQPNDTATKTTFNNGTTRFFNYRDQYYAPGTEDKYVKFPQYGVFY
jgi:hypothetical protein